jgi:GTP cyclohydrolase II
MARTPASDLPSHASPIISPVARPSAAYLGNWADLDDSAPSTPGLPHNLISPAFTPPATPGASTPSRHLHAEPKSIPVDTSLDDPSVKQPRLVEKLPQVECLVRARIPTTSGAEMFLHLYQNDSDNKEHLAIVFGNNIRSRSLDAEKPGETEMDRMIRGAYVGRLTPGRTSSRVDPNDPSRRPGGRRMRSGSALKNVTTVPEDGVLETNAEDEAPEKQHDTHTPTSHLDTVLETSHVTPASMAKAPLVRIHSECYTGETAWSARCDCGEQLDEAARLMSLPNSTGGVIVYLRQEGRGIGLASKLKAYNLQDLGNDTVEANLLLRHPADARTYGLATAILQDLGLGTDSDAAKSETERGIRLLTNNPDKVRAVEGPAREVRVRERVPMIPIAWRSGGVKGVRGVEIEKYLETKIGRMGHMIHEES